MCLGTYHQPGRRTPDAPLVHHGGVTTIDRIAAGMGRDVNEMLPELADYRHPQGRSLH